MHTNTTTQVYMQQRTRYIKRRLREMRENAGLLQKDIASALGCTRTRIVTIENEDSPSFYDTAEIEIVAALCGRSATELSALSDEQALFLAQLTTDTLTSATRGPVIDCRLTPQIQYRLSRMAPFPPRVVFSPDGSILASMIDTNKSEKTHSKPDTLMYWDVGTGDLICSMQERSIQDFAPISASLVAFAYVKPSRRLFDSARDDNRILLANPKTFETVHDIRVPNGIQCLAISPDERLIAAFLPATTLIGIWEVTTGKQIYAIELETIDNDPTTLGLAATVARTFDQLERKRKTSGMHQFQATRFEFLALDTIALRFRGTEWSHEFTINAAQDSVDLILDHPPSPIQGITHRRVADWRISVTKQDYNTVLNVSQFELCCRGLGQLFLLEPYEARFVRQFPGRVDQISIVDDSCILGVQEFRVPYTDDPFHHYRYAAVNLVTGHTVVLDDGGRLSSDEDMLKPSFSPSGTCTAYWVTGDEQHREQPARLCLQQLHLDALQAGSMSLGSLSLQDAQRKREERQRTQRTSGNLNRSRQGERVQIPSRFPDDVQELIAQLHSSSNIERHDAIRDLCEHHLESTAPTEFLNVFYSDPDPSLRREALSALGTYGEQAPRETLLDIYHDTQYTEYRPVVIEVFGQLGKRAPLDLLISLAQDSHAHPADRESAVQALGDIHTLVPPSVFEEALIDQELAVRASAAVCAAQEDLHLSPNLLIACLGDSSEYVRKNIVVALTAHPVELAIQPILKLLDDSDYFVRASVAEAIGTYHRAFGEAAQLSSLLTLTQDPISLVRETAIGILTDYPEYAATEALSLLLQALSDEDVLVRVTAARALTRLGRPLPEVHTTVLETALKDPDPRIRKAMIYVLSVMRGLADPGDPPELFNFNVVTIG